jgi:glycosyltransferase involved in cell wall biosynthesis
VSVVIPTHNRRASLAPTVLAALDDSAATEVVVVVDGCRDGSLELLETMAETEPRLRPQLVDHGGETLTRQRGAEMARGEVLLFLDDDVIAGPNLASNHARHHVSRERLLVLGYMPVATDGDRGPAGVTSAVYADDYELECRSYEQDPSQVLLNFWAGNFSIRRDDALSIGLTSPAFPDSRHGDRDFGLRCARQGMTGVFDRSLGAHHRYERSIDAFLRDVEAEFVASRRLHELHADLIGPFDPSKYEERNSGLRRWAIRAGRAPRMARVEMTTLRGLLIAAGWARRPRVQNAALTVARSLEQDRCTRRYLRGAQGDPV